MILALDILFAAVPVVACSSWQKHTSTSTARRRATGGRPSAVNVPRTPIGNREANYMAKKRGNSEGSIYRMKDGRWRAAVMIGKKPDGKPIRKIFTAHTRR